MRLYQTLQHYSIKYGSYHVATYAASASFFIMSAVFPLLMLALSILSFTSLSTQDFLEMIAMVLPGYFRPILQQIAEDLMVSSATALSISLVGTLWTASKSMLGLLDGLNAIADINDTRNFIFKRIICIGYVLVMILGLIINLSLRVFGRHILILLEEHFPYLAGIFASILEQRGLTLFLVLTVIFMLIYTVFPNKKMKFYLQLPGAAFTSLSWLAISSLFSIYVNRVGQFSAVYGGLTMMILAMLWLYFCMYIVFVGAVFNKLYPELFWRLFVVVRRWQERRRTARMQARRQKNG